MKSFWLASSDAAELKNQTEYVDGNEGDHVTLKCEAEGRPAPVFSWSLDGKNLMETTSDLNITLATNAIYICTASNYLGNTTKLFDVYGMKTNVMGAPSAIKRVPTESSSPFKAVVHCELSSCLFFSCHSFLHTGLILNHLC